MRSGIDDGQQQTLAFSPATNSKVRNIPLASLMALSPSNAKEVSSSTILILMLSQNQPVLHERGVVSTMQY